MSGPRQLELRRDPGFFTSLPLLGPTVRLRRSAGWPVAP